MTARELQVWLRGLHEVPEPSVDRIITGDASAEVRGIAVVWTPTWAALREARERGCNVVVAHEPTYFTHLDAEGFEAEFARLPAVARAAVDRTRDEKRRWIEENELVVIRCHDVLDSVRGGVVDSLAAALGFTANDVVRAVPRYRVVKIDPPMAAADLAQRLATTFGALGQPGVAFYGDPKRLVRSLGLGTGYGCEPWTFVDLGAEMCVTIDDRIKTWTETEWADDSGYPMIVIHHGTSEEWGVRQLKEMIAESFPKLAVHLVRQGFRCRWIPATGFSASDSWRASGC
jgi:putative NIF3 family GTP cyclohydrolase 1 type 2